MNDNEATVVQCIVFLKESAKMMRRKGAPNYDRATELKWTADL
jgi:hypothetical protein